LGDTFQPQAKKLSINSCISLNKAKLLKKQWNPELIILVAQMLTNTQKAIYQYVIFIKHIIRCSLYKKIAVLINK